MPVAFAKVVRSAVAESRPSWKFLGSGRRNGRCVDFGLPATNKRFRQTMFFREDYPHTGFVLMVRPVVDTAFLGKNHVAGIDDREGRAVRFRNADELRAALARAIPNVERLATAALDAHTREAERLAKLFDRLEAHFKRWFGTAGSKLTAADFDEAELAHLAFKAFKDWLERERLLIDSAEPALWHWWRSGDPCAPDTWGHKLRVNAIVRTAARRRYGA